MSAITLDPPSFTAAPPARGTTGPRTLPSRLAFTSRAVPALVEATAIVVTAAVSAGAWLAFVGALAAAARALRTPVPSLLVHPWSGAARYLVDMAAVFGVAVAIGGSPLAAVASAWAAVAAAGFAARAGVEMFRQRARRARPAARLWLLVLCDDEARALRLDALMRARPFGIDPHTIVTPVLYRAYFLREPDVAGYEHWLARHLWGHSLYAISVDFARSLEFTLRYGALSDHAFLERVYQNVLERPPDSPGRAYWIDRMAQGMPRGQVMIGFSESTEFQRATADGIPAGYGS